MINLLINKKIIAGLILILGLMTPLPTNYAEAALLTGPTREIASGAYSVYRWIESFYNGDNLLGREVNANLARGGGVSAAAATAGSLTATLASKLFNVSIYLSVYKIGDFLDLPGVADAWRVGRDLANFFFIFILLYIAISTVLEKVDWRKLLTRVIIIALLVNFSAVLPKIVIDATNILALNFYHNIGGGGSGIVDLSEPFIKTLSPDHMNWLSAAWEAIKTNIANPLNIFNTKNWLDAILFFILSYILIIGAIFFIVRIVILMLVVITSPLAFMAWIIPATNNYSSKWWEHLIRETVFAPVFMFLMYASLQLLKNQGLREITYSISGNGWVDDQAIKIINFLIVAGTLLSITLVARSFGGYSASKAMGWGGKIKSFGLGLATGTAGLAGVYGLGSLARQAAQSETLRNWAASRPIRGSLVQGGLDRLATAKFGTKRSYSERVEKLANRAKDFSTDPELQARYIASLSGPAQLEAFKSLSDRQKAVVQEASGANRGTIDNLIGRLSLEEQEKIDKARGEAAKQQAETADRFEAQRATEFFVDKKVKKIAIDPTTGKEMYHSQPNGTDDKSRPIYEIDPATNKPKEETFNVNNPTASSDVQKYLKKINKGVVTRLSKAVQFEDGFNPADPNHTNNSDKYKLSKMIIENMTTQQVDKFLSDSNFSADQIAGIRHVISQLPATHPIKNFINRKPNLSSEWS